MPEVLKTRVLKVLLAGLILPPIMNVRSADTRKMVAPSTPRTVTMRRSPRQLSRGEIFQAIQKELARRGISGGERLRPDDLIIQSSVPVTQDDPGLEVLKISFDPIRRETVFELWTSQESQYLPINVMTRRDPRSWGFTALGGSLAEVGATHVTESQRSSRRIDRAPAKAPVLAHPGRPATLVILGQDIRITTTVDPLQPGVKGQVILVRDPATAQVMNAQVVGEGLLEARL